MDVVTLASRGEPFPGSAYPAPVYRIPALAVTGSGRVLAAYDVRLDWRDLPGDFDIALRHSDDHGVSWSTPRALRAHADGRGYGDASFVTDAATGRVLCFHVSSSGRSFWDAEAGPGGAGLALELSTSDDDGLTWTHAEITALKPDDVEGMFSSSGNGIQLTVGPHAGRLLQPFVLRRGDERFAAVARSDDHGASWALGEWVGPDCDENKVVEAPDGRVLLLARATPRRRIAVSDDGGVSFGPPVPHEALVDPACNGGAVRVGTVLVQSLLDDESQRRRLVLRTSSDAGASWSGAVEVDLGACGYSVLVQLADGSLGLAYEAGDYDEIVFCRITPTEAGLGTVASLRPRPGRPGSAKPPEAASAS